MRSAKPGQPARAAAVGAASLVDVADADGLDPAGRRGVEDRVEVDRGDVAAADDGDPQAFRGHDRTPSGRFASAQS